jgi:hypothetical protein
MLKTSVHPTDAVRASENWLLTSGIQSKDGYFFAWVDRNEDRFAFPYPEITGYGITALCFLSALTPNGSHLKAAERAADWLCLKAIAPEGGVRSRFNFQPEPDRRAELSRLYAFDSAMAGYGLLQSYTRGGKKEHLDGAKRIYHFLSSRLRRDEGSFNPFYDEQSRKHGMDPERWSGLTGGYGAKLSLFLLEMAHHGEANAKGAAESLLDHTAAACKNGLFEGNQQKTGVDAHPHAYTLEGLLAGYVHLKKPSYLESIHQGHAWLKKFVASQTNLDNVRTDVIAQTLRIALILSSLGITVERPWIDMLLDHLTASQIKNGKHKGAWTFRNNGEGKDHANAWSTFFALQALAYLDEAKLGPQMRELRCFI